MGRSITESDDQWLHRVESGSVIDTSHPAFAPVQSYRDNLYSWN